MHQILFWLGLRGDYSTRPEPLAGTRRGPTSKGREGKRRGEDWGREVRGRNVEFHHLLLSNLTTGYMKYNCSKYKDIQR